MNKIKLCTENLGKPITAPDGYQAWKAEDVRKIMEQAQELNWMALGGDVINPDGSFHYCNWHYSPDPNISLESNVNAAVETCLKYIANFVNRNGDDYYYTIVMSDAYRNGACWVL